MCHACRFTLYVHVCIPLVGRGVEVAPAGCILGRHHTAVQTTQHGHHVVLDGTCNCEVLEELWPAVKTKYINFSFISLNKNALGCFQKCMLTCFSCTRRLLHSQSLWPRWDVSLDLEVRTGSCCCSAHPARWSADWCLWLWRNPSWTNYNLQGERGWRHPRSIDLLFQTDFLPFGFVGYFWLD